MFLGADTEELQEAGQQCQEGAEATGQVIMYLRALVIALKAASFFTGGASAAYAQYLETTVIPWLERIKQALDLFAKVLLAHADAQNRVSAGESVDWSGLPSYRSPALPAGDTRTYPTIVAPTSAPVTAGPGAGGATGGTGTPAGSPQAAVPPSGVAGVPGGSGDATGPGSMEQIVARGGGLPGGPAGTSGAGGAGANLGGSGSAGSPAGSPTGLGGGTPGGLSGGVPADGGAGGSDAPVGRISTGTIGGVDGGTNPVPVTEKPANGSGATYGAAAGIAGGAAALGLGGAAVAARGNGKGTDADLERLAAANGRGSRGEEVRELQERLTAAGYDTQGADGVWGSKTQAAYEAWRTAHPVSVQAGTGYTAPSGFDYNRIRGVAGNAHVTPEFLRQMEGVAQRVGARPEDLMAVMAKESTLNPAAKNPGSTASGLIQFMERTASGMGTTTAELRGMTAIEQLPYVERYLAPYRGRIGNLEGLYTSILAGKATDDPSKVLFRQGTQAYHGNRWYDHDHNGLITAGEATDAVRKVIRK